MASLSSKLCGYACLICIMLMIIIATFIFQNQTNIMSMIENYAVQQQGVDINYNSMSQLIEYPHPFNQSSDHNGTRIHLANISLYNIEIMRKKHKYKSLPPTEKWKLIIMNFIIDDRIDNSPTLRILGIMPFQLLDINFWHTEFEKHHKWVNNYCHVHNECVLNKRLILKTLSLPNLTNNPKYPAMVIPETNCSIYSLLQNHDHIRRHRIYDVDYAMVSIDCSLPSDVKQTWYNISQFQLELSWDINPLYLQVDLLKPILDTTNRYARQYINYNYVHHNHNLEIRWRYKVEVGKIAICTTATYGFPIFIGLWIQHHLRYDFVDDIYIYVNYKHIKAEYAEFLDVLKKRKIAGVYVINWTITNELPNENGGYYEFQQLAYYHCMYHNMYMYKWISYLDTDDFMMVLNQDRFMKYLHKIEMNYDYHSINLPWISWRYCCLYQYLIQIIIVIMNMNHVSQG